MAGSRTPSSVLSKFEQSIQAAATKSWNEVYKGRSHQLLWEHINNYYMASEGFQLYENMCAVVQSSGMGKSRTIDELGKNHFLIPINLRDSASGYPPPDDEVRKFLTGHDLAEWKLASVYWSQERCFMFLYGLFKQTLLELQHVKQKGFVKTKREMTAWFHNQMSPSEKNDFRSRFFQDVIKTATQRDISQAGETLNDILLQSALDLVGFLRSAGTKATQDEVQVVLAFDEADVLCDPVHYDPAPGGQSWSMLTMLREALRYLYSVPVWPLFISMAGKPSQFNPHHGVDPSMRIRKEKYKTVPAFTALRCDIFAPRIGRMKDGTLRHCEEWNKAGTPPKKKAKGTLKGECLLLKDVTKTKFMVKFGRPLFYLMWHHGESAVQTDIIRFAMSKLICDDPAKLTTDWKSVIPLHVALACLSQRLCIEFNTSGFDPDEETQIASHMRLCLQTGPDNQSIMSSSGSEPILAEAAATVMQMEVFRAAELLKRVISGFDINKGDRGELVALLAITRARDLAVKQKMKEIGLSGPAGVLPVDVEETKPMFRAVTVMEFLSQLFSLDKLKRKDLRGLSLDFKDAYVYFNHFVRPLDRSTCTLRFILQYMTRGAGVLSSSNMPGIAAVLCILFKSEEEIILREDHMSIVLFQVENDRHIKRQSHEKWMMQGIEDIVRQILNGSSGDARPVIRIVFSLGSSREFCYSKSRITLDDERSVTAHDFWCGGICDFFLPKDDESKSTWEALVSATMKWNEVFDEEEPGMEEFREEYESLFPGGSKSETFWSWIEDTDGDGEESETEETSMGEKSKGKGKGKARRR